MASDIISEVVAIFYGRDPEQASAPELYEDDGFDYALVKLPRGFITTESQGTVSIHFATEQRPKIHISK